MVVNNKISSSGDGDGLNEGEKKNLLSTSLIEEKENSFVSLHSQTILLNEKKIRNLVEDNQIFITQVEQNLDSLRLENENLKQKLFLVSQFFDFYQKEIKKTEKKDEKKDQKKETKNPNNFSFVDKIKPHFYCVKCKEVIEGFHKCPSCDKNFCLKCSVKMDDKIFCSVCVENEENREDCVLTPLSKNDELISNLMVSCNICQCQMKRGDFKTHFSFHSFSFCSAKSFGCNFQGKEEDLEQHHSKCVYYLQLQNQNFSSLVSKVNELEIKLGK